MEIDLMYERLYGEWLYWVEYFMEIYRVKYYMEIDLLSEIVYGDLSYEWNSLLLLLLLLLQSALQPLWLLACSTIVDYSQQEGFYRVPFPAARQTPQLGGPVIRTFQLSPPGVPHAWNDESEPQQRKVELWARNCREFCRKWRLPRHF